MIAIKDMEMPKRCKDCPMVYTDITADCYWCNLGANESLGFDDGNIKLHDCPLISIEQSEDCVSRQAVIDELNRLGRHAFKDDTDYDTLFDFIDSLPPVTPTHGTCKDCKHYHNCNEICHILVMQTGDGFSCGDFERK